MSEILNYNKMIAYITNEIKKRYWDRLYCYIKTNNVPMTKMINLLLNFEEIVITLGNKHIAIEYYEKENNEGNVLTFEDKFAVKFYDYSKIPSVNLLEKVVGITYDSTVRINIPLSGIVEDLICPTSNGFQELNKLGWNFYTQNAIIGFNAGYEVEKNKFCRIINGTFFDANDSGLITRRSKIIDFIPILYDDSNLEYDTFKINLDIYNEIWKMDIKYKFPQPEFYEQEKVLLINKFIELYGNKNTTEPQITSFLSKSENEYILKCRFSAQQIYSQKKCEWQSDNRPDIQPDFFVLNSNGYADIVEFKLPNLKNSTVVGKPNRETFSAEIHSYISQTRVYQDYFDDPNNRKWVETKYGLKVYKPKRFLIVGRRFDFSSDEWQQIKSDYSNSLEILTYDDLIDGVIAPLFC